MGLLPGEAYASEIVTPESLALPIPKNLGWLEAAAIPEAFITAFDALFLQVGLTKGETVLIHAVGSGVGTAAVQLSHARGAEVFGTSSSDWKLDRTKELGLSHAINRRSQDFHKTILEQTKGEGVNVIADLVGGSRWNSNLESLSNQGRLILIGLLAGARTEIDLSPILRKRLRIIGTILRSRSMQEKIRITNPFREQVLPLLESGVIKPIVDSVFPLADAAEAHRRMESNQNWGKIVLTV
jgi:NADPH:quinone reductase-like Zn-dependent oxidoreductase